MTTHQNINPNAVAKTAGLLYLSLIPLGVFGILYIDIFIKVPGDITATLKNILSNEFLVRSSVFTAFVVQIVNIFVALTLHTLLKPASKIAANLMVIFILVAMPVAFVSQLFNVVILMIANGGEFFSALTTEQTESLVAFLFEMHKAGISIAQIFWGLWLFPMGYAVYKSNYIPKIIGVALMIGCFGYLIDSINYFVFPNVNITLAEYLFFGEIMLPIWLLVKGVKVDVWHKRASQSVDFG